MFDSDLNRNYHNMPCNYTLHDTKYLLPQTLVKEYRLEGIAADGSVAVLEVRDNHQRLVRHKVDWNVCAVRLLPLGTHGCPQCRIFGFEVL